MKYLLDTNVISELRRPRPDENVVRWFADQEISRVYLSAVTVGEINRGIERLSTGKSKAHLQTWLEELRLKFAGRIFPVTDQTFSLWGKMYAEAERKGHTKPILDLLLEATAVEHDLILVTRNVRNFQHSSVTILNPWED